MTLKKLFAVVVSLVTVCTLSAQGNIEFIENKGQWDNRVRFKGDVSNGVFFIREGGFTVVQHNPADLLRLGQFKHGLNSEGKIANTIEPVRVRSHAWNVDFVGASPQMAVIPEKPIPTYNNYFIGNDPSRWAAECRIYQGISIQNIYPGVDVRYYTDKGSLKYDILVKPGGDVSKIALKYDGVDKLQVKNKELVLSTSLADFKESIPYTFQPDITGRREVKCKYIVSEGILRFKVDEYDHTRPLVIDPTIIFCSFSGSRSDNWGFTATYGPDESLYGGGIVFGNGGGGFPVSPGAYETQYQGGEFDIGIIKLTPNGSSRVYATYIGGSGKDQPHSLIVDPQGNLILAGRTNSSDYPVINNGTAGGTLWDIVITKLNATGTALLGSRKIGGSGNDGVNISDVRGLNSLQRNYGDDGRSEVILDGAGNVYVASSTQSADFPGTKDYFQPDFGGGDQDGVLLKLSPNLNTILFASYLGGSKDDAAYVLSLNPFNNDIYVAGGTESTDLLPNTQSGGQNGTIGEDNHGLIDGFVAIINNGGTSVIRSAYIGTVGNDQVFGVQFDANGFPYIMGQTTGSWPIVNATYGNAAGKQFISKLKPDLSGYVYSTAFGSGAATPNISPVAFLVDRCENVYISGWGGFFSTNNPFLSAGTTGLPVTPDAFKSTTDGKDLYFFVLKKDAVSLLFGSFFGEYNAPGKASDHVDGGTSRFDRTGKIYQAICGNCDIGGRSNFPTTAGAWSTTNNASNGAHCNLALLKIDMDLSGVRAGILASINGVPRDTAGCVPLTVDFTDTLARGQSYEWHFGDGSPVLTTTVPNASHLYSAIGHYLVMLVAFDPTACNVRDTSYVRIRVGDIAAVPKFVPLKLPPCGSFDYRFDNTTVEPPVLPFTNQSFTWDFGDGSPRVVSGLAPVFHSYTGPGTYNVRLILQDTNYCNAPDSFVIALSVADNVRAGFTTPPTGCIPYDAVFNNTSLAGQSFFWDFGDGSSSTTASPTHTYTLPGTYTIMLVASNPNTCNKTDTAWFTIQVFSAPVADFNFAPQMPVPNTPVTFINLSTMDAVRFKWEFGDGDSLLTTSRANFDYQYNATGTFNACLTAYNNIGCPNRLCRQVSATINPLLDVPNAFTPQSGDVNSVVMVKGFGIVKMQFIIYNRWGQKVFETHDRRKGWDGKWKGAVQPMDVYVYTLAVEFFDGTKTIKKGDITLIR
ncbi:MAG: PKD domain-containing protein [Sphingobacteriales bacterium]|nr:PKD domain-containing protein [Sphingobacteriales bacterium]